MSAVLEHIFTVQTGISAGLGYGVGWFMGWRAQVNRPNRSTK